MNLRLSFLKDIKFFARNDTMSIINYRNEKSNCTEITESVLCLVGTNEPKKNPNES